MNLSEFLDDLFTKEFIFRERPAPVPGDARLAWRLSTCLLILYYSRSRRASLRKIHFLGHAMRTDEGRSTAEMDLAQDSSRKIYKLRVEPAIGRALDFGRGSGLVDFVGRSSYQLTSEGAAVVEKVLSDEHLLTTERSFLLKVKDRATEGRIKDILEKGVDFGA